MNKMKRMKNYCTCGAYWTGPLPDNSYDAIEAEWKSLHSGEGHAPCDSRTAARAREKAEREEEKRITG